MPANQFGPADPFVLYAIAWAGSGGATPEVIEPCFQHLDYWPTDEQLNDAIARCEAAGLVRVEGHRVFAGVDARGLFEQLVHLPARTIPEHFKKYLSTVSPPAYVPEREYFSGAERRAAADAYRSRIRRAQRE